MQLSSDIQELIDKSKKDLETIKEEYNKSLNEKQISTSLKISIKNCLENLRSSLDYLGKQIYNENNCNGSKRTYFPIFSKDKASFDRFMQDNYPNLDTINQIIHNKLEDIQFFKNPTENQWMSDLVTLVNENKHEKLSPQTRTERKELSISSGGTGIRLSGGASIRMGSGTSIRIGGKTIYGGQTISPDSNIIAADPALDIKKVTWIDFIFDELSKPVIPTLSSIIDGVQKTIDYFKS
jgi:hypothetical protein